MNILSHFSLKLNSQQEGLIRELEHFMDNDERVFLLKGYAGTGKTTLVKGIINALSNEKRNFVVCAPTGRAANILRNKTGFGKTIHSTIYDFENLLAINADKENLEEHSFKYFFPIVKLGKDTVIIVDEASMISSRISTNELFDFGTNVLLDDLLTYAQLQMKANKNKLLIIGDPAQLAPVGDNNSWALEKSYFEEKNIAVSEVFLTQVMRQDKNLILENARRIRKCIENPNVRSLEFSFDNETFIDFTHGDIVAKYCELFPEPAFDSGVIINYSNAQNLHYNNEIRSKYFPGRNHICEGDIVQIISNNYHKYPHPIFNGEFAQIVEVGDSTTQSASLYVDERGNKEKKVITFKFREVKMIVPGDEEPFEAYINETLLESTKRDLTVEEMKAVYINSVMRFRASYPSEKVGSEFFKNFLKNDGFFNAIRVKYGYAITGHKSQGGEWDTVFVDYYGRVSLRKDPLRWCYTVSTRASNNLYAVNYPKFGKFYKLNLGEVKPLTNIPSDAKDFSKVPISPFHKTTDHRCKSLLYWNILEKCEDSPLSIENVRSFDYLEKYTFNFDGRFLKAEAYHNGAGFFREFTLSEGNTDDWKYVKQILSVPDLVVFPCHYQPTQEFLKDLYILVQAAANDCEFSITNIIERTKDYHVNYFFETDAKCSQIQFYFNGKNEITKAQVKSTDAQHDEKLRKLLRKINKYASVTAN